MVLKGGESVRTQAELRQGWHTKCAGVSPNIHYTNKITIRLNQAKNNLSR